MQNTESVYTADKTPQKRNSAIKWENKLLHTITDEEKKYTYIYI